MTKLGLVSVKTTDKLLLPGLLYEPPQRSKAAAVWLHGMGDNGIFYNPSRLNALGSSLTRKGIALLAFNNRGAHGSKSLRIDDETLAKDSRHYQGGTYYEKIADCVMDIDGASSFLKELGYETLYLLGHSSGANKICAYQARATQNPFSKYVLVGAADDVGLHFMRLGKTKFWQALTDARQWIERGKPQKVMPAISGMHPFSAQSTVDLLDPDGAYNTFPYYETRVVRLGKKPLFEEVRQIDKPTLVIFGDQDEYLETADGPAGACGLIQSYGSHKKATWSFELVAGADHGFHNHEAEFADRVATWLAR